MLINGCKAELRYLPTTFAVTPSSNMRINFPSYFLRCILMTQGEVVLLLLKTIVVNGILHKQECLIDGLKSARLVSFFGVFV